MATDTANDSDSSATRQRKRDVAAKYFKQGELQLKRAAGLGHTPNVVPVDQPRMDQSPRQVLVGWHPVGGVAGKWFANETALGKLITEKINKYPDPTQHWAVLVGDYAHQLWMDENFDVIYTNARVDSDEWTTFPVGVTRFNDDALRRTGEMVIESVRAKNAAYNLITNNCQTYALMLLDAIKAGGDAKFATTLDVYQALVGPAKVADLFNADGTAVGGGTGNGAETVSEAANVMNQHTAQLDPHRQPAEASRDAGSIQDRGRGASPKKKGKMSRFKSLFRRRSRSA